MDGFYRIRDFKNLYLHYDNKEKKGWLTWIKIYIRHDGEAYRRIIEHERHESILLCFFLILQVSANMPKRGDLIGENGPITAEGLAYRTGIKVASFKIALEVLVHPKINWIEYVGKPREIPGNPGKFRET